MHAPNHKTLSAIALATALLSTAVPFAVVAAELPTATYNNLTVVNGGAGSDESDAIKRAAPRYALRVVLSGHGGDYFVADRLTIANRDGIVAEIPAAGPWLLMDLPPGRYTLKATFGSTELAREVTVGASGTTVHWVVPNRLN